MEFPLLEKSKTVQSKQPMCMQQHLYQQGLDLKTFKIFLNPGLICLVSDWLTSRLEHGKSKQRD